MVSDGTGKILQHLPAMNQTPPIAPHAPRTRRSTIEDVAAAAGVSVATVSRALRGLPNVAASTRSRVVAVAETLGYTADPAASRLAAGRGRTITAVIPHLNSWYFSTIVAGTEAICAEAGYDLLVLGVGSVKDLSRLLSEAYHLERRTDGLLLVDVPITDEEAQSISARGVSIATIGIDVLNHPSVRIDDELVGRTAADLFVSLGHERTAVIGWTLGDSMQFEVPQRRLQGFTEGLGAVGRAVQPDMTAGGHFSIDGGQEAMSLLLDHPEPPSAVFAMSDEMAFGAIMELTNRGLVPGRDVSVIGVDDHEFSRVVGLTTIRQTVADHGATAARLLLNTMHPTEDDAAATHRVIPPVELIVRSTTCSKPS
ncbi:MAG: LacI family repressor for deo operon, udp, cdd, tsx, nupC, and nupG [Minisyncoccia bacterium]